MFLVSDLKYPSLRVKKMQGVDAYEARVDIHYRLTFGIVADVLELYTVGMHDTATKCLILFDNIFYFIHRFDLVIIRHIIWKI